MEIINLTPHAVTVAGQKIMPTLPPARCDTITTLGDPVTFDGVEIPVEVVQMGRVTNLPDRRPDTIYVVSRVVAESTSWRRDLYIPHDLIRDADGVIIGCRKLAQVPTGAYLPS